MWWPFLSIVGLLSRDLLPADSAETEIAELGSPWTLTLGGDADDRISSLECTCKRFRTFNSLAGEMSLI